MLVLKVKPQAIRVIRALLKSNNNSISKQLINHSNSGSRRSIHSSSKIKSNSNNNITHSKNSNINNTNSSSINQVQVTRKFSVNNNYNNNNNKKTSFFSNSFNSSNSVKNSNSKNSKFSSFYSTSSSSSSSNPSISSASAQKKKKMREINIAIVSGLLLATSYVSITNNYFHADTLPPNSLNSLTNDGKNQGGSAMSFSTSSMNGIGVSNQQNKEGIYLLNEQEVSRRLRQFEESYNVKRGKGVMRYDICQFPSNNPIEDDRSEKIVQLPIQDSSNNNEKVNTDWMFWGVYDGHAGWTTSAKLRDRLLDYVVTELGNAYKINDKNLRLIPTNENIDKAIKQGFLKLDDEIVNKNVNKLLENPNNKAGAAELLMPALSGSCGLVSFYDTHSKILKVAVTGDSRALLGSLNEENNWTVTALSIDQTGSNPTEVAKLLSEHPNEPNVVRNGRVLGSLEPTRAFGDARYKWPKEIQTKIYNQFFGRQSPANLKTPPYVTAEPIITTTEVHPSKNDFLVMASDGLFEMLTNEEIIGLVVKWMENKKMVKPQKSLIDNLFPSKDKKLPKVLDITDSTSKIQQKQPFRRKSNNNSAEYILEDENVSTHLIRNALSNGGNKEETAMLVSIPSPLSRRYRDDLTVTVVFFGEDGNINDQGILDLNKEATKGGLKNEKPKL